MHRRWQSVVFVLSFLLLLGFVVQLVGTSLSMSVAVAQGERRQERTIKARLLYNEGVQLFNTGQLREALERFQQTLVIFREIGDRSQEGTTLNNIGGVYYSQGQYQQALNYYQQALKIHREIGDRSQEGTTQGNIGVVYHNLSQYQQALDYHQQALKIAREIGNRSSEGTTQGNIGEVYRDLGQYQQALDRFQQALNIHRKIGDRSGEAIILNNTGSVYDSLGQYQQALDYYQQALKIFRKIGYRSHEGTILSNIGEIYHSLGQYRQVLDYLQQALNIHREVGNRSGESVVLNNIGGFYNNQGQYQQALDYYQQALKIIREVGRRDTEAKNLSNIGKLLGKQNQSELAIVFYKQSVKVYESIREGLRPLPRELQESYTETVTADIYRALANLLLEQDRILEAQRVLDLLKLQEIEDYNRRDIRGNDRTRTGIELLSPERQIWQGYEQILNRAVAAGTVLTKMRQIPETDRTPDQKSRLPELESQEKQLQQQLNDYFDSPPVVALVQQLQRNVKEQRFDLAYLDILQKELGKLRIARRPTVVNRTVAGQQYHRPQSHQPRQTSLPTNPGVSGSL